MSEVWGIYYAMSENEKPKGLEELLEIIADNVRKAHLNIVYFITML